MCTGPTQEQVSQNSCIDGVDDLQATPFTEGILATDSLRSENHLLLRIWSLTRFLCPRGWPHKKELEHGGSWEGLRGVHMIIFHSMYAWNSQAYRKIEISEYFLDKELYFYMSKRI